MWHTLLCQLSEQRASALTGACRRWMAAGLSGSQPSLLCCSSLSQPDMLQWLRGEAGQLPRGVSPPSSWLGRLLLRLGPSGVRSLGVLGSSKMLRCCCWQEGADGRNVLFRCGLSASKVGVDAVRWRAGGCPKLCWYPSSCDASLSDASSQLLMLWLDMAEVVRLRVLRRSAG
jgi:hypothetical protein